MKLLQARRVAEEVIRRSSGGMKGIHRYLDLTTIHFEGFSGASPAMATVLRSYILQPRSAEDSDQQAGKTVSCSPRRALITPGVLSK